jgi:hypothetical protein
MVKESTKSREQQSDQSIAFHPLFDYLFNRTTLK